ncbi:hypothetical protein J8I29_07095 [Labrys sp. LIt4]|uniref:hypothetical protein n=1 Tax=Labrys sp. LIt4 TaxID=2821355 RepID=UPI001ADF798C|nr:hypothetical protein [Labrys sp. LIt4]MBP0579065.1 hypothetical protein [Labrys sp. LIt4]
MTALMTAELAWYATGRFYRANDGSLADYGYFLHLPFADAPLFDGKPAETSAHFTFAATPFKADGIDNGALSLELDPVGQFSLYLQRRPGATFADPASFAQGECIATFRRTSLVVGTTVAASLTSASGAIFGTNVFSARLIASNPFEFAGKLYDLAQTVGMGITQFGTAATTPVAPPPPGYDLVLPFTGSAIALGRAG